MLFEEQISRKPDNFPWAQKFIEAAWKGFWTDKEFSFNRDKQDFLVKLNKEEQTILVKSLSLIGQLEISVKKFWSKLGDNCPHPSLYDLGFVLANQEVIHGSAYERLLEVLGIEDAFDNILKEPIVTGRVNYLRKHLHKFHSDNKKQFIYSLILFTLFIENIALFSQFYTISWFKRAKNVVEDTAKQVEYTSREEDLHAQVGIKLINEAKHYYPDLFDEELKSKIIHESNQILKYECEVISWILGDYDKKGENGEVLNQHVVQNFLKDRMNKSLIEINFSPIFEVDQEFLKQSKWFYEQLYGNNNTDFFHSRPTEYSKNSQSFDEDELFN